MDTSGDGRRIVHDLAAPGRPVPWIDEFGILRMGDRWVALSDSEWQLMVKFVARFGKAVTVADLRSMGDEGEAITPAALNVRLTRLRQRIQALDLRVINVRRRGYILDRARVVEPAQGVYESE